MATNNKTAVITGATGGLGRAVTTEFLNAGWQVIASYVQPDESESLLKEARRQSSPLCCVDADLTVPAGAEEIARRAAAEVGAVDALINLVGGFAGGSNVIDTPETVWDHMVRLNLKTTFLAVRAIAPLIVKAGGGAIITVGARSGVELVKGMAAYGVSKAGVLALTQVLAEELLQDHVRVNCILPSVIDTPTNRQAMPDADFGKWVKPQAIASLILYLCSDDARHISGAAVPIYGDA